MNRADRDSELSSNHETNKHLSASKLLLNQKIIAEAAYYRAEKRGFVPGFEDQDWAEAEAEIGTLVGME